MKIATKFSMTAFMAALALCAGGVALAQVSTGPVTAQPVSGSVAAPVPGPVASAAPPAASPVSSSAPVSVPAPVAAPADSAATTPSQVKEVLDAIKVPGSETTATSKTKEATSTAKGRKRGGRSDDEESSGSEFPAASPKIPESVRKTVKKLNDNTDDITLDSLNSAREAVVKLDVLIDIEKRLNDLAKLRKDRQEKMEDIAGSIPPSALPIPSPLPASSPAAVPPSLIAPTPIAAPMPMGMAAMSGSGGQIEVQRISGASGRYSAQIKDTDGQARLVRVGDKLSDGAIVDAISRDGVTYTGSDKKTKTIQVKDIGTVFSSR